MDQGAVGTLGRCAVHPDRPANETCSRCGDYLCLECMQVGPDGATFCSRCPAPALRATRGTRFGANLLDNLVVGIPAIIIVVVLASMEVVTASAREPAMLGLLTLGAMAAVGLVQVAVMASDPWRRSFGKRFTGIRVAMLDGSVPPLWRLLLLRNGVPALIGLVPVVGRFFGLVDAGFIFGNEQRCIHDLLAGTHVVVVDPNELPRDQAG